MRIPKTLVSAAVAAACLLGGTANAAVTLTNADSLSPFVNFGGFDWAPGSVAWTSGISAAEAAFQSGGVNAVGNVFTIRYAAHAVAIVDPNKNPTFSANMDITADGGKTIASGLFESKYEYTIYTEVTARVTSYLLVGGSCSVPPCVKVDIETLGGTFDIFYDTSPDALRVNNGAWTGYKDGVGTGPLISGQILAGQTNTFDDLAPVHGFGVDGIVTSQDTNYINPTLTGTRFTSEMQFRQADPGFLTPTSVDGTAVNTDPSVEDVFSVDGSQLFFADVPEPASLLLVGGALLAAGGAARRRKVRAA